ncbi:MAG: SDR family NAD(P)-dependent oxidoreductase [Lachnospiraceae bacterium]|nr:SDR family NAD(P)-dependent oxidoreductase [Lachnospiraceae bacterium]
MRKKALITGASRGIGAATARALGQAGYDLFLVCKSSEKELHIIKEEIEKSSGVSCEAALCDVSDPKQVEAMVQKAGEVHILVNNAAISHVGLMTDMSLSDWHRVIDTNLSALFYLCRLIVPQMVRRQSGKILNVSSVWGNAGASMETAYSASKGGVNSFTKALAKELAPSDIQVNAVAFGVIETDMNVGFSEEEMDAIKEEIPADRLGTPEEAAQMICGILGMPGYFTGQVVTMDGGWM